MDIKWLINQLREKKASSIHIVADMPALMNINSRFLPLTQEKFDSEKIIRLADSLMNDSQEEKFIRDSSVNFTYDLGTSGRIRVSFYKQRGFISAIFKPIISQIPSLDDLNLPDVVRKVTEITSGLVVIGGPAGSGKSSTVAAILNEISKKRNSHIITLESPIEFFFNHNQSLFSQREIGIDSFSFPIAMNKAMRQDPDVIMISDINDHETIKTALTAAEIGILVFGTMHTTDCVQTISRIINAFPPDFQHQICTQTAIVLKAVICQQLIMRTDTEGKVPAIEMMFTTPGIKNLIRERKIYQIYSAIESGSDYGMQTLDQALKKLYDVNVISDLEVVTKAVNPEQISQKITETEIQLPEDETETGVLDAGEEIISIDRKLIRYQATFIPGDEGYWTSSVVVVFQDPGMVLHILPGSSINRIYLSDFNIVSKKVPSFKLSKRLLIRFKMEGGSKLKGDHPDELLVKLFTQPEKDMPSKYNKINLSFPLEIDQQWHTWVIDIPPYAIGKFLKITMFEFPLTLTKIFISDIIFF